MTSDPRNEAVIDIDDDGSAAQQRFSAPAARVRRPRRGAGRPAAGVQSARQRDCGPSRDAPAEPVDRGITLAAQAGCPATRIRRIVDCCYMTTTSTSSGSPPPPTGAARDPGPDSLIGIAVVAFVGGYLRGELGQQYGANNHHLDSDVREIWWSMSTPVRSRSPAPPTTRSASGPCSAGPPSTNLSRTTTSCRACSPSPQVAADRPASSRNRSRCLTASRSALRIRPARWSHRPPSPEILRGSR